MIIIKKLNGCYIQIEKKDFKGDWEGFVEAIKKLKGVVFNPPELDDENWWFIPKPVQMEMIKLYHTHIEKVLQDKKSYEDLGYKEIPRKGGRFNRKRLKF